MADPLSNEPGRPPARLHHAHLMASDLGSTIEFWRRCFGATVVADESMAGSRNVFLDIGGGRLNLYDKEPNQRGPVNHLGVHVVDLVGTIERLRSAGWEPRPIKVDGPLSYSMVEGPDALLIEVFHFDEVTTADHLRPYFDLEPRPEAQVEHGSVTIAGVRCLRAGPSGPRASAPLLVYLPGARHTPGGPEAAAPVTERLAAHVDVLSLDYRLTPEYPHPAALEDTLAVVDALTTGPDGTRPLVLAGDSAGADLALSAGLAVARQAGTSPAVRLVGLILLNPQLDHRPHHPSRSDELGALPPTLIQVGTADAGFLDAVRFARAARAAGSRATLDVWDGPSPTWHDNGHGPEAEAALLEAARFAVSLGT